MHQALRDALTICKTLLRNGYDAHLVNPPLQERILAANRDNSIPEVDIACEPEFDALVKLFPKAESSPDAPGIAQLEENGAVFNFYPLDAARPSHPEMALIRLTPSIEQRIRPQDRKKLRMPLRSTADDWDGMAQNPDGSIRLLGLPDITLHHNYILAIRALRFAANYDARIEPNSWMAIVRSAVRALDYVPVTDIMEEWRKVAAESMHRFVRLLYDSHILQGLIPELAGLTCVVQQNDKGAINGNVFEHTLKGMELYPQEGMHYDWIGAVAMLFHDIGKLYTAEFFDGRWTYYQHHQVGAQVTRKILRRLRFDQEDIELICHLVNNHMRFHFMMTDRGIRRFKSLGETARFMALAKADLLARDDSFTSYNHNVKYLDRAETPEQMLEPLLNGNEIMEETRLAPGRLVGIIRDALLDAQKSGLIADREAALRFVREFATNNQ